MGQAKAAGINFHNCIYKKDSTVDRSDRSCPRTSIIEDKTLPPFSYRLSTWQVVDKAYN